MEEVRIAVLYAGERDIDQSSNSNAEKGGEDVANLK